MSTPSVLRRPDDTAPSLRGAPGFLCPKCKKRFDLPASTSLQQCPDDGSALILVRDFADAEGDPMLGRTLGGRFTILARLGAGSMGTVYRARQHPVGRDVAIKILRSDRAIDEVSRARFLREARANSLLASPNTVTMFDFGQGETGDFFLAMELLEGESLGQRLKRLGRLSPDVAIETARQSLRSLSEAHAKGIIHRDLKPDNLFYARMPDGGPNDEVVKVLDFGIAKMLRDPSEPFNAIETQAGTVFGTPRYMSPEQAQAKPLDARSDLYSLGVILYHMLVGRPPFMDDDAIVVMARHIKSVPKPFADACPEAMIPPEIERVVMRALAKEPSARPETAEAMAIELMRALESDLASTSGVRMSMTGRRLSTPPVAFVTGSSSAPPSSRRPPPLRAPSLRPPSVRPDASAAVGATDSLDIGAARADGGRDRRAGRRGRSVRAALVGAGATLLVLAVILLTIAATRPAATGPTSMAAPRPLAATAPHAARTAAPPPASTTPTVAVEALPVAAPTPGAPHDRPRSAGGTKAPPRAALSTSPAPPKGPAPAHSSSNYGLFE